MNFVKNLRYDVQEIIVRWRFCAVLLSTTLCLGLIGTAFWYQDWQYSIPAVRPADLEEPPIGSLLRLQRAGLTVSPGRPLLLHFFNPQCPCSRFNLDHLRSLIRNYGGRVRFIAVLEGEEPPERLREKHAGLNLGIEAVVDEGGGIAREAGVYATPQAVIVDPSGRLYFRGNYNLSRYCTVPDTEFARIALQNLVEGRAASAVPASAAVAYGCPFPRKQRAGRQVRGMP